MLIQQLLYVACRKFAASFQDVKSLLAQLAELCGTQFKCVTSNDETVHLFSAQNRQLVLRNYEQEDLAKLKGEALDHVDPIFNIIKI